MLFAAYIPVEQEVIVTFIMNAFAILLTLKTNLATYCQKSPIGLQSLFFHTSFKDWVVV